MMGSEPPDTEDAAQPDVTGPDTATQKPRRPEELELLLASSGRASRFGRSSSKRWVSLGCMVGLIALVALLMASVTTVRRSMHGLVDRACVRLEKRLPLELGSGDRERLRDNLNRLRNELRQSGEPNPLMGEFLALVAEAMRDDRLSVREVRQINELVESRLGAEDPRAGPRPGGAEAAVPSATSGEH